MLAVIFVVGALGLTLPARAATGFDAALTRAPYLTDLVQSNVAVNWATNQASTVGSLTWGPVTSGTCSLTNTATPTRKTILVGTVSEYQWTATLTLPNRGTFCYRPFLAGTDLLGVAATPQFQGQVAAGDTTPYSFDVLGDWGYVGTAGSNPDMANLISQIASSGARFAVGVGDAGYPNGSEINYGDLQQTGGDTSAIFGPSYWTVAGSTIPLFSAAGNHGLSNSAHTDITTWTENTAVSTSGGRYQNDTYCCVNGSSSANLGSEWYAFDAGAARFYVLDSAWGDANSGTATPYANDAAAHFAPGTPEYTWLLNDLQTHPNALKFSFSHYPFYVDNPNEASDTFISGPTHLEGLLSQYGVKVAFNGHAHLYQRNKPSAVGMPVTYVTGAGGPALEPVGPCTANDAYGLGWSPSKSSGSACGTASKPTAAAQVFHFLKVTVDGNTVTVAPTNSTGGTFDVQTYTFSGSPDTVIDPPAPPASTNSASASIAFHSTLAGATFACTLDGAAATACTSPAAYTALANGPHTFTVAATTAGGTDTTPATTSWTVDSSPPTTPTNLTATAASATSVNLSWTAATDNVAVASYDVLRDGTKIGTANPAATSYVDTGAAPSTSYSYTALARDTSGNLSGQSSAATAATPASSGAPALAQNAASSTTTVTLPGTSAAGDLLVLSAGVFTGATKPITAVKDDAGNTWTKAGAYMVAGQNSDGEMWYAANAKAARTITVTTAAPVALSAQEFSGVATTNPLDGQSGAAGTGKSALSGAVTPTVKPDLAVGFAAGHASNQAITVGSGFSAGTQQNTAGSSLVSVVTGSQVLPTTGLPATAFTGTFTNTMYWAAGVALFRPAVPVADDFSVAATPSTVGVTAGNTGTTSIGTADTSGAAQTVTLSASGLPTGATATFAPASVTAGGSSQLSIATTASTPAGTYPVTVTGTGSSTTHSATVQLTVAPVNDFSMSANPASLTITAGQNAGTAITTALAGGSAVPVTITATGNPAGMTLAFTPASVTSDGGSSTMTVTTAGTLAPGSYSLTVTGTTADATHTVAVPVTVKAPDDFTISPNTATLSVAQGQSGAATINTAVSSGNAQAVALSSSGLPTGATATFAPSTITGTSFSTMTIAVGRSVPTGTYQVSVTGTGPSAAHSTIVNLTVSPAAAPRLVQATGQSETASGTSLTATLPAPSTAGNLLVLSAGVYTGATNLITSVTDSGGNTWTKIKAYNVASHNSDGELWYSANAKAATTVTVKLALAASMALEVQEFAGVATTNPLDTVNGTSNTSTVADSGTVTPAAGELVIGFVAGHASTQKLTPSQTGFTVQPQVTTTATSAVITLLTGYQVAASTTPLSFGATFPAAMYWAAGTVTFRAG